MYMHATALMQVQVFGTELPMLIHPPHTVLDHTMIGIMVSAGLVLLLVSVLGGVVLVWYIRRMRARAYYNL